MDKKLDAAVRERMRCLCRQISVAHGLDEEIRAELYTHMEDKLLGYLSGKEKITEDDAFILVQKHFGDPGIIKELFQGAHAIEAHVGFLRRLGVVAAASLLSGIIGMFLFVLMIKISPAVLSPSRFSILPVAIQAFIAVILPEAILSWIPAIFMLGVLYHWKKRLINGYRPMFFSTRAGNFAILMLCLYLTANFLGHVRLADPMQMLYLYHSSSGHHLYETHLSDVLLFGPMVLSAMLQCIIWLWWLDTRPRLFRTTVMGLSAWMGYYMVCNVMYHASYHIIGLSPASAVMRFFRIQFGDVAYFWAVSSVLGVAAVSLLLYLGFMRRIEERRTVFAVRA